jgi:drug/metabolite transporter (DMT)-like permease
MPQFALLLTTVVWGATFPATKAVLVQLPPFTFLGFRFVLGTVLVWIGLLALGQRMRTDRHVVRRSAVATVFLFLGYATQTVGLQYTTASNSAFITVLYVIFVPLLLRRFSGRTWISASIAMVGLWFLVKPSVGVNLGDGLTLACAAFFAGHIACLETYTRQGNRRARTS